jgi:transposase
MQGGADKKALTKEDLGALEKGLPHLEHHLKNVRQFGVPVVIAINRFGADTDAELKMVNDYALKLGAKVVLCEVFAKGGEGGETLGEHGYSKDYRPDLKQMILALIVDGAGRPICTEMWPGNTADVATLLPVIDRLRHRFSIRRVCVVADRGMISAATIEGLEARKLEYILGARERSDAIVRKIVLENEASFTPLLVERKAGETQLFVKQVKNEGKRYRNEAEAEKDRKDREAIVTALDAQLKKGDKALVGNSAYLRKIGKAKDNRSFEIDAGKLAEEARFDGIFVLRTNAKVTPLQAVLRYRDLLQVENLFLRTKAIMRTRPIFHSSDAAIRGVLFLSGPCDAKASRRPLA